LSRSLDKRIRLESSPVETLQMINTVLFSSRALNLGKDSDVTYIFEPPERSNQI